VAAVSDDDALLAGNLRLLFYIEVKR